MFDCDSIDASVIPKELQEIYQEHKLKDHDDEIAEDILKLQENKQINPLDKKVLKNYCQWIHLDCKLLDTVC